jgi:pyrimidine deaminase RibD-like protein
MKDRDFMKLAIEEAKMCRPEDRHTHPKVGAVVVKKGQVLAKGHRGEIDPKKGQHAEFTALELKLGTDSAADCTVYTTLEPCTTRRHPKVPCAYRLIERKVARVVIGMLDPNQDICGRGIRALRDAGITTDLFPHNLMAIVEEQNREFIREQQRVSKEQSAVRDMLTAAGISAFFPSRDHYREFRAQSSSITSYVNSAEASVVMVSVNLMTGMPFDGLCEILKQKLEARGSKFSATISLLNPRRKDLMSAMAPVLDSTASKLARAIEDSLERLTAFRRSLHPRTRQRVGLFTHNSIPFGSAILLDHRTPSGRIQIETKPYRAPIRESFAFEVVPSKRGRLYEVLAKGYHALLRDGQPV